MRGKAWQGHVRLGNARHGDVWQGMELRGAARYGVPLLCSARQGADFVCL